MTLATYLLYLSAVALLVLTPGPTMLMCVSNAINHGPARALASVSGSVSAALCVMTLSALGLGALLAASAMAFLLVKLVGAGYLIWLGVKTFRQSGASLSVSMASSTQTQRSKVGLYWQGFGVGASNPKALLFAVAFFPQFLNPEAPFWPQMAILAGSFVVFEFTVLSAAAVGVARLQPWLKRPSVLTRVNQLCGGLFTALGSLLLFTRRHA